MVSNPRMNISRWLGWLFATSVVLNVQAKDLRIGMVGLDTSHVTAFTRILNDKSAKDHIPGPVGTQTAPEPKANPNKRSRPDD